MIRLAREADVSDIERIAKQYPSELAFVRRNSIMGAIGKNEAIVAIEEREVVGFCLYHTRRDGITTIYDVAVDKGYSGRGIGRELVASVPAPIKLKCKADNTNANEFYRKMGFSLIRTEETPKSTLYVWMINRQPQQIRR